MNNKEKVIASLKGINNREDVLKKLKENFIKEDESEPFQNREYAEETIRIFDLLIGGFDLDKNEVDNATFDIVTDIFNYYGEER